jgi:hypothetical protein
MVRFWVRVRVFLANLSSAFSPGCAIARRMWIRGRGHDVSVTIKWRIGARHPNLPPPLTPMFEEKIDLKTITNARMQLSLTVRPTEYFSNLYIITNSPQI